MAMDHGQRLQKTASEVARMRAAIGADAQTRAWTQALKNWQAHRLARTYADLLAEPRHGAAARFFLQDLYGAKDFSQRDAELARLVPMLVRLLPEPALATIADAIEMDALSERLDLEMATLLRESDPLAIDEPAYADAYRHAGSRRDRERQIELIGAIGQSLDRLVRHPMLGRLLKAMGGPARVAGLSQMHEFLMRGFEAFRAIDGASGFLARIEARERAILEALHAGARAGWSEQAAGPASSAGPPSSA
ncbi:MAG: hypothetical protein LT103_13640 [Burkholderiaceae bacterium]|nr:hypothetical protein [Burkholderiaceae bacterium]